MTSNAAASEQAFQPTQTQAQPEHPARRQWIAAAATTVGAALTGCATATATPAGQNFATAAVTAEEHWTQRQVGNDTIRLYLWRKRSPAAGTSKGTILFVHGSSMAGTPVFDLQVPGKPQYSAMDRFARMGYDTWCLDHEGYGKSSKSRPINFDIANGADDLSAVSDYIIRQTGDPKLLLYGISSGALRAALFAEQHPERVRRIALDAFVWTGEGSPTLANRRKRLNEWQGQTRRPIDHAMVESIFTRDHPGTADMDVVKAFADAILKLDTSVPTGTYVDMSARLPVCNPEKMNVPTLIMRGQFDGIASFQDLVNYFAKLPHPDKRFVVMPGIAHSSLHEKNLAIVMSVLENFFGAPAAVYQG
jgi:pimeloyl-ACP methyl ester carboxylesterase